MRQAENGARECDLRQPGQVKCLGPNKSGISELRRASASETLDQGRCSSGGQVEAADGEEEVEVGRSVANCDWKRASSSSQSRLRLSSDPQNAGVGAVALASSPGSICEQSILNQRLKGSKTFNSSSISGVSSHFQAHNEQTIGRSTTTTAGKTATSSANYSSLLNRKIGVIFLEGSYCERLVESGANFEGSSSLSARQAAGKLEAAELCGSDLESESAQFERFNSLTNHTIAKDKGEDESEVSFC